MTGDEELFEKGRKLLKDNNTLAALACFEQAAAAKKVKGIASYLGLCLAVERGQIREGIKLCEEAIQEEGDNPVHYLHLGKVFLHAKRRQESIDVLRRGLTIGDSKEIRALLDNLGTRRKPVFPFLPRGHFLNKYFGLFLRKIRLRW